MRSKNNFIYFNELQLERIYLTKMQYWISKQKKKKNGFGYFDNWDLTKSLKYKPKKEERKKTKNEFRYINNLLLIWIEICWKDINEV